MNHTLEQAEKAVNWFKSKGINAETNNESVKIRVEGHWVFISSSEIEWRAEMWDDEGKEKYKINVVYAVAVTSGQGHKKVTVELEYNNNYKKFTDTSSNIRTYDEAMELEGQDKLNAIYSMIEWKVENEVKEWIESLNN